jgi:glycosyltransferase involved in cell wall biosynthesis
MKIIHISYEQRKGGAAIAANRLSKAMIQQGLDSCMLVANYTEDDNNVTHFSEHNKLKKKCYELLSWSVEKLKNKLLLPSYVFTMGHSLFRIDNHPLVREADVIYVHWISCMYCGIRGLEKLLQTGKPVYLFMHDMWAITGGCHHSFECDCYMSHCKNCPIIQRRLFKGIAGYVFSKKKALSKYSNLHLITPSEWLADCARKSALFKSRSISVVPNLLNTSIYRCVNKSVARSIFGLPQNRKLVLFGCNIGAKSVYKGWSYLQEAMKILNNSDIDVVMFGGALTENMQKEMGYKVHSVGFLSDEYSLMLLYNAVDVFVTPSLAESFGMTVMEAQSCGVIPVGFNVGGLPDLIKHLKTGYLANYKDSEDLAKGIEWALNNNSAEFSQQLHMFVDNNFSYPVVVGKHQKVWEKVWKVS